MQTATVSAPSLRIVRGQTPLFGERRPATAAGHDKRVRTLGPAVAVSETMHEIFALVGKLAPTTVTVTLTGETGTGKDVFAHAIHESSLRAAAPFVVFDCGAIPSNLIESELFGHERGAFTGAHAEHIGAFERANGGTLFLDEVGEMPLALQPRLLRALDRHAVRRVGGTRERAVDVRVVSATNCDLSALVASSRFRQDLYFRLAAAIVRLPALRERREDIPVLVSRLLKDLGHEDIVVPAATLEALAVHTWPGNLRELKNTLACSVAFVDDGVLEPRHLRFVTSPGQASALDRLPLAGYSLESVERAMIKQTLAQTLGNKLQAAKSLGVATSTLYEKLKRYGNL